MSSLIYTVGSVFMLRFGGRNCTGVLLCFGRGVSESCLSGIHMEMNKLSPHCHTRHSSDYSFHAVSTWVICLPFLKEQGNALWALSKPRPLTFKSPGFKPHCLEESLKTSPSHFPSQCLWINVLCVGSHVVLSLLPFSVTSAPFPP